MSELITNQKPDGSVSILNTTMQKIEHSMLSPSSESQTPLHEFGLIIYLGLAIIIIGVYTLYKRKDDVKQNKKDNDH